MVFNCNISSRKKHDNLFPFIAIEEKSIVHCPLLLNVPSKMSCVENAKCLCSN